MANSIDGRLVSATTRRPVPSLTVEAIDPRRAEPIGTAVSDAEGAFSIAINPRIFLGLLQAAGDIGFRVLGPNQEPYAISGRALWNGRRADQPVVIVVREPSSPEPGELATVQGVVTDEAGVAAAGLSIEAWDHNVGGAVLLGSSESGPDGSYAITYESFAVGTKETADLEVRAVDQARDRAEVARSAVVYAAGRHETVDLTVPRRDVTSRPEYARLIESVEPLLGGRSLADVGADDVTYLAGRAGWDARSVAMAAQAARLGADSRIPGEHYYALMRTGLPGDLSQIHRLDDVQVATGLERAVKEGIIGADAAIDTTVELHREAAAGVLRTFLPPSAVSTLGDMLSLRLDGERQDAFLDVYRATSAKPEEMWSALAERGFDRETIAGLQTDAVLGQMTLQNAGVVARLTQNIGITAPADLADRGFHRAGAWVDVISGDVPEGVSVEDYAAGLAAQVAARFPTRVTADLVRTGTIGVSAGEVPGDVLDSVTAEVADFLAGHDDRFTIGVQPMRTWDGFAELSEPARAGAQQVERLFQISPSNDSMVALAKLGIGSARQVMRFSPDTFVITFGADFPSEAEARMVYRKAQEVHTTALNIATAYLAYRGSPNVYAITGRLARTAPEPTPEIAASATLEDLFANMDYCACDHCGSVLSPAAYLVELFELLDRSDVPPTGNPLAVLFGRRPDLQHLALSCENTNVALPYIDIVNEILEHYVVNGSLATFAGHDTAIDAATADLLADPEFVIDTAYDATRTAVYPWSLPFDMPLEHVRLLFEVWDASLADALHHFGLPADARRERLRLNATEHSILTDLTYRELPEYFGEPAGTTIDALNDVVGNAKTFCRRTGITYSELAEVLTTRFVNPGGDVDPIVLTDVAPDDGNVESGQDNNDGCDFGLVELRFDVPDMDANRLTDLAYHRLHRFIRLWKKLGWSIATTDRAITVFLGSDPATLTLDSIDAAFSDLLARLAAFATLTDRLEIPAKKRESWLALWDATADAAARRDQLAALLRLGTTDLAHLIEITGVDPLADDLATDEPSMVRFTEHVAALKASPLKVVDLDFLLRHDDLTGKLTPSDDAVRRDLKALRDALTAVDAELAVAPTTADLASVTTKMALVYDPAVVDRFVALVARSVTYRAPLVTPGEVLPASLSDLAPGLGLDPFRNALTITGPLDATTQTALEAAADALDLADVEEIDDQPGLDAFVADLKAALQALRDAAAADLADLETDFPELKSLYDTVAGITDPAARATAVLTAILPGLRAALHVAALRTGLVAVTKAEPEVIGALTSGPEVLHADGDPTRGVLTDLSSMAAPALDADGTFTLLVDPVATADHLLYVRAPTGTSVTVVVDGVTVLPATAVDADGEVRTTVPFDLTAAHLTPLELTLAGLPAGGRAELHWRSKGLTKAPVPAGRLYDAAALDRARRSLLRLQKAVMLQKALGLTAGEVADLGVERTDTAGVWQALDVDGSIAASDLHAQWARLEWLLWFTRLKRDHEPDTDTFLALLRDPGLLNAQAKLLLAGVMEWPEADLTAVLTAFGLTLADLAELRHLRRVAAALELVATTLQPAADLIAWSVPNPDGALTRAIRDALRARLDDAAWLETMRSVSDQLRNARRDALVAYILHHDPPAPEIVTPDHLYEHFLVDVQMDACMQTSRIRLALSTVQLFVNRCLMNLELEVSPDSINADHWQWMRRYRVWEANRKVFLYPENWLEPELRDGKSPFFRELESELLKADITNESAEAAYLTYLKKLDDVAHLEVAGAYLEQRRAGNPDDDVLHVIGRTLGSTREHYYRRHEYGYWTPWEKISLNIEGEVLVPVVWKRRLFVFWFSAVVKASGDTGKSPQDLADESWGSAAGTTAEITVHWGQYYRGAWTSPKSSETTKPIVIAGLFADFDPTQMLVTSRTYTPSAAGGVPVSERLELLLFYRVNKYAIANYMVTFTSTNSAPIVVTPVPLPRVEEVIGFNYGLLQSNQQTAIDANSVVYPGNVMTVRVKQPPSGSVDWRTETLLTKTANLYPGFRVRPIVNPAENPWELPLFYSDEHSVFVVEGDESVSAELPHYYVEDFVLHFDGVVPKIPELQEEPVRPVIPRPGDPLINPNYKFVIPDNDEFEYAGATFDARGAIDAIRFQ